MLEKLIAIYGAVLSTLLAIPIIKDAWENYFSFIRFICIDYTRNDVEKGVPGIGGGLLESEIVIINHNFNSGRVHE